MQALHGYLGWQRFPIAQADATAYDLVLLGISSQVAGMGYNSLQNGQMNIPSTRHVLWNRCVSNTHGMECGSKFYRNPIFLGTCMFWHLDFEV